MAAQIYDLRDLLLMIKEKKGVNANMTLEFDCKIEAEDIKPIVQGINYAINYVSQLTEQEMQISLNAGVNGLKIAFTASTSKDVFPELNPQVVALLEENEAKLELDGEPAKFVQLLILFEEEDE
jgi:hypothetical protein